jgi:flagellar basal body-associated protein FliL
MGAIIQTMTLAAILLIIGLVCLLIGVAGLMWSMRRDRLWKEKTRAEQTSDEIGDNVFRQPATRETSLKS